MAARQAEVAGGTFGWGDDRAARELGRFSAFSGAWSCPTTQRVARPAGQMARCIAQTRPQRSLAAISEAGGCTQLVCSTPVDPAEAIPVGIAFCFLRQQTAYGSVDVTFLVARYPTLTSLSPVPSHREIAPRLFDLAWRSSGR